MIAATGTSPVANATLASSIASFIMVGNDKIRCWMIEKYPYTLIIQLSNHLVIQNMTKKPVIGLTLDFENGGGYSVMPWYAIRENYCTAISDAGGVPLPLPHDVSAIPEYFSMIDGLVVTGGNFDIPPSLYGVDEKHEKVTTKESRTKFEWDITKLAIDNKKPLLGICGGEQLMNVVLGGSLIQHIPDAVSEALQHEQQNPRSEPGHIVSIVNGSLLHKIVGELELDVNTSHHQAVDRVAAGVQINSKAEDGVIEGVEYSNHPFCLGVQWHPEYYISKGDRKIFAALVDACRK